MMLERLKKLTSIPGASGFEEKVAEFIEGEIVGKVDKSWKDRLGNLIALKKSNTDNNKKLMLCAHMDEVGLMVKKLNDDGTVGFTRLGGVDPRVLIGKKVFIGEALVPGVIGFDAIHVQKPSAMFTTPEYDQLSVYTGSSSRDEISGKIKLGDPIVFSTEYEEVGGFAIGKAFDDRSGCEVLLQVLEYICENPVDYDVYFAWVVQEETGLRGSGIAATQIKPDAAIIFESTTAGDNPELPESRWATRLGQGPALTFAHSGLILDKRIFDIVVGTAKSHVIPFQYKSRVAGGTDAARVARTESGIPTGVISTPSRYIHSPVSVININDFNNVVKLAKALVSEGKVLPE